MIFVQGVLSVSLSDQLTTPEGPPLPSASPLSPCLATTQLRPRSIVSMEGQHGLFYRPKFYFLGPKFYFFELKFCFPRAEVFDFY